MSNTNVSFIYHLPKYVTHVNNRCVRFEVCFIIQVCQINSNLTFAWYIEIINSIGMVVKQDLFLQTLWKNFTIFLSLYTRTVSIKFMQMILKFYPFVIELRKNTGYKYNKLVQIIILPRCIGELLNVSRNIDGLINIH